MTQKIIISILIISCWLPSTFLNALSPEIAQDVFDELLQAIGHRKTNPSLSFNSSNDNNQLAKYNPLQNNIVVHKNLLSFADEFGEKNKTVLALVLSHELAHHFGNHQHRSGFTGTHGRMLQEAEADEFAIFFSYMAGYPTQDLDASFLKKLYQKFNISESSHYPSLAQRIEIYEKARAELQELFVIFETGNLLLLLNQYESAAKCFDQIGFRFNSPEILTNAGVSYTLAALNLFDQSEIPYLFPLEFEEDTKLQKTRGSTQDYSDKEIAFLQNHYLALAEVQFKLVLINSPQDINAYNHLASVYMLQAYLDRLKFEGKNYHILSQLSLKELETAKLFCVEKNQFKSLENSTILKGIFAALNKNNEQAKTYFQQVVNDSNHELARRNLCILENNCPRQRRKKTIPCDDGESLAGLSLILDGKNKLEDFVITTPPITLTQSSTKIEIFKSNYSNTPNEQVTARMIIVNNFRFENDTRNILYVLETTPKYAGKTCLEIGLGDSKEKLIEQYGLASEVKNSRSTEYYKYKNNLVLFGLKNNTITKIINYKVE